MRLMHLYLIEGGNRREGNELVIVASSSEKFETDKQAATYAEFVQNECKFDVVTVWRYVSELRRDVDERKV